MDHRNGVLKKKTLPSNALKPLPIGVGIWRAIMLVHGLAALDPHDMADGCFSVSVQLLADWCWKHGLPTLLLLL